MDKRLRLSIKGTIRFLAVFAVILWLWNFFRSYLLFLLLPLMIAGVILSAVSLWLVRDKIQVKVLLPYHRVGKYADIPCGIRFLNPLRFVGFAIDVRYRFGNLFTGSVEEKKERLWAAPGRGGSLRFLLRSRYAGRLRVSVEEYRVYDLLHLFYLADLAENSAEVPVWPFFKEGADAEERFEHFKGFPKEKESKRRGTEYNPDYEIREYIAGDELKSIHWKLSAKQGKLMVRERLASGGEKVNVLLPLGEEADENDALVEILYGLCRLLLSKEYPVQLFWQGVNQSLCSRFLMEQGELEDALGEILSTNGIRAAGSVEEQMVIEHPAEQYISCRQEDGRRRGDSRPSHGDVSLIKVQDHEKYDFFAAFAKSLVLFALVYGAVGGFLEAFEINFHAGLCMLVLFVLSFVLSAIYETGKKWLTNLTAVLAFFVYLAVAVTNFWEINSGYYYILNRIFDVAREYFGVSGGMEYSLAVDDWYLAVTTFAIFVGMVGVILLNIALYHKCTPFGVLSLTLAPYVIPLYLECSPPFMYLALLLIGNAVVMTLSYGRGRVSLQMRYLLPVTAAAVILTVSAMAFLLPEQRYARMVPASPAKEASAGKLEQVARYGMLSLLPQDVTGTGVSGGKLSKGSAVMPSYETALTVRYTPYSFDPVYLKAFTGVDYIGTEWTKAAMEWPEDANMEMSLYSRQRQFEAHDGAQSQGMGIMEVEKTGAGDLYEYRPYYTDYRNVEENGSTFTYQYYPDNGTSALSASKEPYIRYLHVPSACEGAVRQVCDEAGFGGTREEIAQQITAYFAKDYKYTLRPGFYYGSPDYITHFLTESKKGYCAHFASAAVMLFRQMGIPARYAEGYAFSYAEVVEKGELVEGAGYDAYYQGFSEIGETALIQIEIPEAYAHAWVEIYDSERGWIVVDPTPSSAEEDRTSFWEVFMNREGAGTQRTLGEDVLGGYLKNALGVMNYVFFAVSVIAVILFAGIKTIRKERERRLPGRERVKLEYRRLQKAAAGKNREFQTLRTLGEEIAWMRENGRAAISGEQEEALYQAFFAKEIDYDCDRLCRQLRNAPKRRIGA